MKILSVEVENFRSHELALFSFDHGVNLILGPNGSGKSSIIEAIGIAMFGGGLRDRIESAVMWDKKRAKVSVTFLADDGNEYRAEKLFGGSSNHELRQGELLVARGRESVIEKIKTICGLQGDVPRTFEHVIVAAQNRIAEQFLGSSSPRREYFNRVFQVDLYRKIATDYMKEYVWRQKERLQSTEHEMSFIEERLKDSELLYERKQALEIELSGLLQELKKLEEKLSAVKKERERLESIERNIITREERLSTHLDSLKSEARELGGHFRRMNEAALAQKLVEDSREGNERYQALVESETNLIEEKGQLDRTAISLQDMEREQSDLKISCARNEEALRRIDGRIREIDTELEQLKRDRVTMKLSLEEKEKEARSKEIAVETKKQKKMSIEILLRNCRDIEKKKVELESLFHRAEKTLGQEETITGEFSKVLEELETLSGVRRERETLYKTRVETLSRIKSLQEAASSLSVGLCPLLNEQCKNICERRDFDAYIDSMIDNLRKLEIDLSERIKASDEATAKFDELREYRTRLEIDINSINNARSELEDLKVKLEEMEREIVKNEKQIRLIENSGETIEDIMRIVEEDIASANTLAFLARQEAHALRESLDEIDRKINDRTLQKRDFEEERKKDLAEKANTTSRLECIESLLKTLREELKKLPGIEQKLQDTREAKKAFQKDYEIYNRNLSLAKNLSEYQSDYERSLHLCSERVRNVLSIRRSLEELRQSFNCELLKSLEKTQLDTERILGDKKEKVFKKRSELKDIERDIERAIEQRLELEKKISLRFRTKRKIDIAERMRSNLSITGEKITAGFRERIQLKATVDYRRISGKRESIIWDEDYDVLLISENEKRRSIRSFANLSGGEQVLVSLCLRAAMTNILSGAKFAIFDEPTSNLDKERKELLAQSMRELFGELDQTIIVTHDDFFSEMAQKVIRLGE